LYQKDACDVNDPFMGDIMKSVVQKGIKIMCSNADKFAKKVIKKVDDEIKAWRKRHRPQNAIMSINPLQIAEYCLCDECKDKELNIVTINTPEDIGPELDDRYIEWIKDNINNVTREHIPEDCWHIEL
jgi:hypothetical protein